MWLRGDQAIPVSKIIMKLLGTHAKPDHEYAWLWFGVLGQAVKDLFTGAKKSRRDAEDFLFSDRLTPVAQALRMSPENIRRTVIRVTESVYEQVPPKSSQPERA